MNEEWTPTTAGNFAKEILGDSWNYRFDSIDLAIILNKVCPEYLKLKSESSK